MVPKLQVSGSTTQGKDSHDERQGAGAEEQSRSGVHIQRDTLVNINVTKPTNTTAQRREGGLRPGFNRWGTGSPLTPTQDIRKLKQVEDIRKAYTQENSKFGGNRDEYFGSALMKLQRN